MCLACAQCAYVHRKTRGRPQVSFSSTCPFDFSQTESLSGLECTVNCSDPSIRLRLSYASVTSVIWGSNSGPRVCTVSASLNGPSFLTLDQLANVGKDVRREDTDSMLLAPSLLLLFYFMKPSLRHDGNQKRQHQNPGCIRVSLLPHRHSKGLSMRPTERNRSLLNSAR